MCRTCTLLCANWIKLLTMCRRPLGQYASYSDEGKERANHSQSVKSFHCPLARDDPWPYLMTLRPKVNTPGVRGHLHRLTKEALSWQQRWLKNGKLWPSCGSEDPWAVMWWYLICLSCYKPKFEGFSIYCCVHKIHFIPLVWYLWKFANLDSFLMSRLSCLWFVSGLPASLISLIQMCVWNSIGEL